MDLRLKIREFGKLGVVLKKVYERFGLTNFKSGYSGLIFLLIFICSVINLPAQIYIEDQVEITTQSGLRLPSFTESWLFNKYLYTPGVYRSENHQDDSRITYFWDGKLILPDSGRIEVGFVSAFSQLHSLYSDAKLKLHFYNGDSTVSDLVLPHFPYQFQFADSFENVCSGQQVFGNDYFYSSTDPDQPIFFPLPLRALKIYGKVQAGDSIQFQFHNGNPQVELASGYWVTPGDSMWISLLNDEAVQPSDRGFGSISFMQNPDTCVNAITTFAIFIWQKPIPGGLDHFKVILKPDTIKLNETARILAVAVDSVGTEVEMDSNTVVTFLSDSGKYGSFILNDGTTVQSSVLDVTYADARNGRIRLFTPTPPNNGEMPYALRMYVQKKNRPEIMGMDSVLITCSIFPLIRYAQNDPLWKDSLYDHTSRGISAYGCALSSMATVMTAFGDTITPGELNYWKKFKYHNGKRRIRRFNEGGFLYSRVNWWTIPLHSQDKIQIDYHKNPNFGKSEFANSGAILDEYLRKCNLAIVQVHNSSSSGRGEHWVVVTKKNGNDYSIIDPGYKNRKTLSDYNGLFWNYIVVKPGK